MPKPLSNDLRERVVAFVEAGHSRRAAGVHFRVSPSFVVNLISLYRKTGSVVPKLIGGRRRSGFPWETASRRGAELPECHGASR